MKKYVAIYLGSEKAAKSWESMDEKSRKEREKQGIEAWYAWGGKNKAAIVDGGAPLGKTLKVNQSGVSPTKNLMTAYTVVEASSHEEAAKIFLEHPHFSIFPGDSIEVMECLDIPSR